MTLKKARKNRALARVMHKLRVTGGVKRDLWPLAKTFGVTENAMRAWEDVDRGGAVPAYQLDNYRRFFGASSALYLMMAEIAEYALQGNKSHLETYAMVAGLLIDRVGQSEDLIAKASEEMTDVNKYDVVIEALFVAVQRGDTRNARYNLRDKAFRETYRKHEAEYLKKKAEKEARKKGKKKGRARGASNTAP